MKTTEALAEARSSDMAKNRDLFNSRELESLYKKLRVLDEGLAVAIRAKTKMLERIDELEKQVIDLNDKLLKLRDWSIEKMKDEGGSSE
jgi:polyhydroxyalkanoate synthesis regulator phasin